jgi:hypothetical protein
VYLPQEDIINDIRQKTGDYEGLYNKEKQKNEMLTVSNKKLTNVNSNLEKQILENKAALQQNSAVSDFYFYAPPILSVASARSLTC